MFAEGPIIKCFVIRPNSNIGRTTKRVFSRLMPGGKTNLPRFQGARRDHVRVEN